MERDIEEFNKFGITNESIGEFLAQAEEFLSIKTDNELKALQVGGLNEKDEVADLLRMTLREFMHRISMKFGENSQAYLKFGTYDLSSHDDEHLIVQTRVCIDVAQDNMQILSEAGISEEVLNSLIDVFTEFKNSYVNYKRAKYNRNAEATHRRVKGNSLYHKLLMLCETGKVIWRERNEALANDYVIYNTAGNKPPVDTPESPSEPENS